MCVCVATQGIASAPEAGGTSTTVVAVVVALVVCLVGCVIAAALVLRSGGARATLNSMSHAAYTRAGLKPPFQKFTHDDVAAMYSESRC